MFCVALGVESSLGPPAARLDACARSRGALRPGGPLMELASGTPARLGRAAAAVDRDGGAGDVAGSRRGEEGDDLADFLGPGVAAHRRGFPECLRALRSRGVDGSWGDRVDAYALGAVLG